MKEEEIHRIISKLEYELTEIHEKGFKDLKERQNDLKENMESNIRLLENIEILREEMGEIMASVRAINSPLRPKMVDSREKVLEEMVKHIDEENKRLECSLKQYIEEQFLFLKEDLKKSPQVEEKVEEEKKKVFVDESTKTQKNVFLFFKKLWKKVF